MENDNFAMMPFEVKDKIIEVRKQLVMLDKDVAALYGVETKRVNEAVKNNPDKFPEGYTFQLDKQEFEYLRSNFSTANVSDKVRYMPKVFTEKGLYMLATILKSKKATQATLAIVETYAKVRELKESILTLHNEHDKERQRSMMRKFSDVLSDIVMPDLQTEETESTLELNFIIGKLKHTVKRRRSKSGVDEVEDK